MTTRWFEVDLPVSRRGILMGLFFIVSGLLMGWADYSMSWLNEGDMTSPYRFLTVVFLILGASFMVFVKSCRIDKRGSRPILIMGFRIFGLIPFLWSVPCKAIGISYRTGRGRQGRHVPSLDTWAVVIHFITPVPWWKEFFSDIVVFQNKNDALKFAEKILEHYDCEMIKDSNADDIPRS